MCEQLSGCVSLLQSLHQDNRDSSKVRTIVLNPVDHLGDRLGERETEQESGRKWERDYLYAVEKRESERLCSDERNVGE